jgi:recombination protein RecA
MAKETNAAALSDEKKDTLLKDALKAIEKEYGKGSIMRLGDRADVSIDAIPSGSLSLDQALGIGGYPKGRIVEIFGPESSGKTTLALHAIAECQKQGGRCAFIDAENAIDPQYAKHLGVNIDELILSQPDSGEQALDITELLIKSGAIDLVVIDSVAALVPQAELDGEMGDASVGLQARLMSKAMRKLAGAMNHSSTTAIFINQLREKVGIMFGNPETTPGGRALKFYASVRLDVRRGETLKNGTEAYGNVVKIKVVKNKVAPPFKMALVNMIYGEGISHLDEVINLAIDHEIIDKAGAWFSYNGEKIGQGFNSVREYMKNNPDFEAEVTAKVKKALFPDPSEEKPEDAKADAKAEKK